jgi:hypothetical protein
MKSASHPGSAIGMAFKTIILCAAPGAVLAQGAGLCANLSSNDCRAIASRPTYVLAANNVISQVYGSKVLSSVRVTGLNGNLIAIDFRPSQFVPPSSIVIGVQPFTGLYGLTDTGKIYTIASAGVNTQGTLVGTLTSAFDGGFQSLADFNPVVDALRVIGSNTQNFAVVNSNGGNLNVTAPQTAVAYAAGDPQAGVPASLTAGAYTNNRAGAANTLFYGLDAARNTLVTIADVNNGSSNTGGGRLKTIGTIVDPQGNTINILPSAGMDIFTDATVGNAALISNGQTVYYLNLAAVNASLPVGTTQNVVVTPLSGAPNTFIPPPATPYEGGFIDVTATPLPLIASPADLVLSATANAGTQNAEAFGWTPGTPLTFTVTLTNRGPDAAAGLQVNSIFFPFNDPVITTSQGSCSVRNFDPQGRLIDCNIGAVASGGTVTVTLRVTRLASGVTNRNAFTSFDIRETQASQDPDGSNNSVSKNIPINR